MANPKSNCAKCGRRCHGETCYVCNRQAAREAEKKAHVSKLTQCRWCGRTLKTGATVCTKDDCRPPDISLSPLLLRTVAAAVVTSNDPFPVETTSAARVPTPPRSNGAPRWTALRSEGETRDQERRKRMLERGLEPCECPECKGPAWEEPPITRTRGGVVTVEKCIRCPQCNPARHRASGKRVVA